MPPALRTVVAAVVGTVVALVLIGVVEAVGERVYPPPAGLDFREPDAIASLPGGALAFVLAAWIGGTFAGGLVAARIDRSHAAAAAAIVGALVLAATVLNFTLIPHPAWMIVAGIAGIVAAAYAAGRVARPRE